MDPNSSAIKRMWCININCLDHLGLIVVCSFLLNIRWHKIGEIVLLGYMLPPSPNTHKKINN